MRRREFITLLGLAIAVFGRSPRARNRISCDASPSSGDAARPAACGLLLFAERLRELGWIESRRKVAMKSRFSEGRSERVAEAAAEFVQQKADVIVAPGAAALAHVERVTAHAHSPCRSRTIRSASAWSQAFRVRWRRHGALLQATDAVGKQLELLREVVPGLRRLQFCLMLAIPRPRWKWAMFRLALEASASRSWLTGSGAQRILRPCSML